MKRIDAERNTSFVGNGQLGTVQTASMTIGDTVHPIISIGSLYDMFAGEDPTKRISYQTFEVNNDAGAGSTLRVILRRFVVDETNTALASGVTVKIDGISYTTGAGGVITHNIDGATYDTLHDFIDAINALPGFVCYIGDALTTHPMNTNDFIDVYSGSAGTGVVVPDATIDLLDTLYRDVSEDDIAYVRIGLPRKFDMAPMKILSIQGSITSATGAAGVLYTDNMDEYVSDGSHQESNIEFTPSTNALTEHVGANVLEASTYRGSLVLKVSATDAAGTSYKVRYQQELGTHRNM